MSRDLSENVHSDFVENSLKMLSCFSRVRLFGTPWTVVHQTPLSMEFSRQEYWSGLPFPSPGDLLNSGIKHMSLESAALQVDSLPLSHWASPNFVYILTQIFYKFFYFIVALSLKVICLHIFSNLKDD